jgi:D-alanyl-D-alanine-carboxypeptidase/D-alanyl-D-alanine-endopeptidase
MMGDMKANMGILDSTLSNAITLSHQFQHHFGSKEMSIGLGWLLMNTSEGEMIMHEGVTGGYRSFIGFNKTIHLGGATGLFDR